MAQILVVDDEQVVRDMLSMILACYGYGMEPAEGGASTLALFAARREEIGLVLLDLSMPAMPGAEVQVRIKPPVPEMPVAVLTGFVDDVEGVAGVAKILYQPFRVEELLEVAPKLLGE